MTPKSSQAKAPSIAILASILIGAAIPLVFTGRAMIGPPLILAILLVLASPGRNAFISSYKNVVWQPASLLLLCIFVSWIPNIFGSPTPDKSIETIVRTMAIVLAAGFIFAILHHDKSLHDRSIKAFICLALVIGFVVVLHSVLWHEFYSLINELQLTEQEPRKHYKAAAAAGALMIPVLLWAAIRQSGKWKVLAFLSSLLLLAIVFATRNKAALAGLLAAFALFVLLTAFHRHTLTRVIVTILIFLGCLAGVIYWLHLTRSALPYPDYDWPVPPWLIDWHRQSIWSFAWEQGSNNRWFGTGINAIDKLDGSKTPSVFIATETSIPFHPHNWVVELMIESGFIGIGMLLTLIGYAMRRMIKLYFQTSSTAIMAALCVWAAYWGSGLFNFSFWAVWWQTSFLILSVLCLAGQNHEQYEDQI